MCILLRLDAFSVTFLHNFSSLILSCPLTLSIILSVWQFVKRVKIKISGLLRQCRRRFLRDFYLVLRDSDTVTGVMLLKTSQCRGLDRDSVAHISEQADTHTDTHTHTHTHTPLRPVECLDEKRVRFQRCFQLLWLWMARCSCDDSVFVPKWMCLWARLRVWERVCVRVCVCVHQSIKATWTVKECTLRESVCVCDLIKVHSLETSQPLIINKWARTQVVTP